MHRYKGNGIQMDKLKCPCVNFYPESWLAGTRLMTNEEKGIYIDSLCHQFTEGGIEENEYESFPEKVKQKFRKKGKKFFNERMAFEIKKKQDYSKSRSENRKKKTPKPLEQRLEEAGVLKGKK